MRLIPAVILSALLAVVYWIGATVFTDRIERDITERSHAAVAMLPEVDVNVDGRDVTLTGNVNTASERNEAEHRVDSVWGVRASQNELNVFKPYNFNASNNANDGLKIVGTIDNENSMAELRTSLAPLSPTIDVDYGARPMVKSAEKLKIGTGSLLLLNHGDLKIDDKEFVLNGLAADEEVRSTIVNSLIDKHASLAPLDVVANIDVASTLTQACRNQLDSVLDNNTVLFDVARYDIPESQNAIIAEFATLMQHCPGSVLIEAHADHDGSETYNLDLSQRRAMAVAAQLIRNGVATTRIESFGYGETRPVASNESTNDKTYNRRVEMQYVHDNPVPNQHQEAIISSQSAE